MESNLKTNKGITLIALVITIIVLLILAGVSIAVLTGDNGILARANDAKAETRGAAVEEARDLWKANQKTDELAGETTTAQTLSELLDDLENQKLLIGNERQEIEETGSVTIGSRTIKFEETKFAYILGMMNADTQVGIDVRLIIDFEKYYNALTDNQKLEIMSIIGFKEELQDKYMVEINTFDDFITYYVKLYNEEYQANITSEDVINMIKEEIIPGCFGITIGGKNVSFLRQEKEYLGVKYYSIYPSAGQYYFRPSIYFSEGNYEIVLRDLVGLVNEEISVRYPFDVFEFCQVADTEKTTSGHPYIIENENPVYIYNENGKKLNFSEHFTMLEIDGKSFEYYDIKNNPLNLQTNRMYVIETTVDGNRTVGFTVLEDLSDYI